MTVQCDHIRSRLDDYLDGELTTDEATEVRSHLADCAACEEHVRRARQLQFRLRNLPAPRTEDEFADRQFRQLWQRESGQHQGWSRLVRDPALAAALVLGLFLGGAVTQWFGTGSPEPGSPVRVVTLEADETREVRFAITADREMENVRLTLDIPGNMELVGFPGERRVSWETRLDSGVNMLRVPVRAARGGEGTLTMRLSTDTGYQQEKTLRLRSQAVETTLKWMPGDDHEEVSAI